MLSTTSDASTTQNTTDKNKHMPYDEYVRWLCLLEGVEIVSKRVEQLKKRTSSNDIDWIKPLAFQKYIEERFLSMKSDLDEIRMNESVTAPKIQCTTSSAPAFV